MPNDEALARLAEVLQDEGYRAKLTEGSEMLTSGVGGLIVGIYIYDNNTIQLSCGVQLDIESNFRFEQANTYNKLYRYAKVYIDDEGDVVLSADYLLDLSRPTASEDVRRIMTNFEGCVALFRNTLASDGFSDDEGGGSEGVE